VRNFKTTNSCGFDCISSRFLKDALPILAFYLTIIINTSIVTGIVPNEWKHAIVCPTFKQGDTEDPKNYRPISLLPILSKVLEKIVTNQLYDYISANQLFSVTQHGFRKHMSTETALTQITEQLYCNIDKGEISLLTLCDLSKAFDSVSHSILLTKMRSMNIDEFWFDNYLSNRTQAVKINNHISTKQVVEYGVPQGSVLGPILFNIFINDLKSISPDIILVQFADDAQFLHSGKVENIASVIQQAESTVEQANNYFSENGLKVNSNKTKFLFIGSRSYISRIPEDITIKVGSSSIKPSDTVKNLGLVMDSFLSFEKHVDELCAKAIGLLYFFNRNKEFLNDISRKTVIEAIVISLFSYCSTIWSTCSKTLMEKAQKVQNFAAKVAVGNGRKYDRATPFINKLGWMKFNDKFMYEFLLFIFKIVNKWIPDWVIDLPIINQIQGRMTRQSNNLVVPRKRTKFADKALSVRGPNAWNELPEAIKCLNRPSIFKKELKKYIQSK